MTKRELDMQVAEKIMGFTWAVHGSGSRYLVPPGYDQDRQPRNLVFEPSVMEDACVPHYSSDMNEAIKVACTFADMERPHGGLVFSLGFYPGLPAMWEARFEGNGREGWESMRSPAAAICRAALGALELAKHVSKL